MSGWKSNGDEPTFKWGKRSHTARVAEKPAYFYESFTYDGIEYFLYDSVYLHAVNEPEPYIAKLLKAWEYGDPATKKIKVLWFFRPVELKNWLGNHQPEKNELFLASGKGVGLANINPLEVLVGKCNVICTSKDKRNHPPSEQELKAAQYIFYRVFDVSNYTISENIADKIEGVKVNLLLNRRGVKSLGAVLKVDANGGVKIRQTIVNKEAIASLSKDGETDNEAQTLPKESCKELPVEPQEGILVVLNMKHLPATDNKQSDADINLVAKSTSVVRHENFQDEAKAVKRSRVLSSEDALQTVVAAHEPTSADVGYSENRISKKMKLDDAPIKFVESLPELTLDKENSGVISKKAKGDFSEDKKKTSSSDRVCEDMQANIVKVSNSKDKSVSQSVKSSEQLHMLPEELKLKKPVAQASADNVQPRTRKDSNLKDTPVEKLKSKKVVFSESLKSEVSPSKAFDKARKIDDREVTRQVDFDRSKWFKGLTWEEQMQKAQEHGKLVLLSNLDPSYVSAEVEEIIWEGFREKCIATILQQTSFSSPNYGQAFVIFKTREAAKLVIEKLKEGCLILPNGRPLVAAKRAPLLKENSTKFVGHFSIDKHRVLNKEEWKRAVFTSHCSQPNTIQYEMALEWLLLQKQFDRCWRELHEQQDKELEGLKSHLKKE